MFMCQLFVLLIVEITSRIQVLISMFPFILTRFGGAGVVGTILGLVYSQTRNLLAPIALHACWNLGVIVLLTYLQVSDFVCYLSVMAARQFLDFSVATHGEI